VADYPVAPRAHRGRDHRASGQPGCARRRAAPCGTRYVKRGRGSTRRPKGPRRPSISRRPDMNLARPEQLSKLRWVDSEPGHRSVDGDLESRALIAHRHRVGVRRQVWDRAAVRVRIPAAARGALSEGAGDGPWEREPESGTWSVHAVRARPGVGSQSGTRPVGVGWSDVVVLGAGSAADGEAELGGQFWGCSTATPTMSEWHPTKNGDLDRAATGRRRAGGRRRGDEQHPARGTIGRSASGNQGRDHQDHTDARPLALQITVLIPILAGLIGLFNSFRMMRQPDPKPSGSAAGMVLPRVPQRLFHVRPRRRWVIRPRKGLSWTTSLTHPPYPGPVRVRIPARGCLADGVPQVLRTGVKGCISCPPRCTRPHDPSGTSFQAPGRSRRGSETMKRESSPSWVRTCSSGYS